MPENTCPGLVPQCRGRWTARAVKVNYDLDVEKSKAAPGAARRQTWEWKGNSLDDAAFDQERLEGWMGWMGSAGLACFSDLS